MSKQNKTLVPKSRFPEFQDDWAAKKLGELGTLSGGGTPDKSVTEYWQGDIPWVSSSDIYEDDIYTLTVTRFINEKSISESATKIVPKGSVLFVSRVGTGKLAVNDRDVCTSQDFMNFKPKKVFSYFLGYFFIANKSALVSLGQGTSIKGFSKGDLEKLKVSFPSVPEQQKIADCLSSIDELIAAQINKVAALKNHKKALMQQLFPLEGETVPKLRFAEFQDAGEWEEKTLGDICNYWNGGSNEGAITEDGEYYLISLNSIDINGNLKSDMKRLSKTDNSLQKNDLVMVLSDVAHGNFLGLTDIIPNSKYVLNQRMAGLRLKIANAGNVVFLRAYINKKQNYFKQKGQGSSQQNLAKSAVTDFPVLFPNPDEQKKIADCLSSIDELISAQTQKLQAYQTHKKGLMQQLFPVADDVSA